MPKKSGKKKKVYKKLQKEKNPEKVFDENKDLFNNYDNFESEMYKLSRSEVDKDRNILRESVSGVAPMVYIPGSDHQRPDLWNPVHDSTTFLMKKHGNKYLYPGESGYNNPGAQEIVGYDAGLNSYNKYYLGDDIYDVATRKYADQAAAEKAVKEALGSTKYFDMKIKGHPGEYKSKSYLYNKLTELLSGSTSGGAAAKKKKEPYYIAPELVKGTKEYYKLRDKVLDYNKKGLFNALPMEVIRLSLLQDMMPMSIEDGMNYQIMNKYFGDNKSGFVLFHDPNSKKCQKFYPIYAQLAKMLMGKMPVASVDCLDRVSGNDILAQYLNITGYPVLKVYEGGKFKDYSGGKTLKDMLAVACKYTDACEF